MIDPSRRVILDSFRRVVRALRVSSKNVEKKSGLTSAQLFVLQQLKGEESLSMNEVAARTFTHQSTVSEVVGRLLEAGLVAKKTAKDDARRLELSLSAKGVAQLKSVPRTTQEDLIEAMQAMSSTRRMQLAELLEELISKAGLLDEPPTLFFEEKN